MRKIIYISIPIVILIIFVIIMLSGSYFRKDANDDFLGYLETLRTNIENDQWDEAMENVKTLDDTWKKAVKKLQFSEERDHMNRIDVNIARLKGAINANDKVNALVELSEAKFHWNNLGR